MLRVPPLAALPLAAVLSAAVLSAAGVRAQQPAHGAASEAPAAPAHVDAFVQELCIDCHGGGTVKGSLDLTRQPVDEVDRLWRWSRMRDRVLAGEMPPPDETAPTEAERARFAEWVAAELARRVPALPADPGRVTVRRLSRGQWRNAVRDLLGIDAPIDGFPADDLGYGFDSIGDALSFSTLHLETYLAAARRVSAAVFHGEVPGAPERRRLEAERMHVVDDRGVDQRGDVANLYTNATLTDTVAVPRDGEYRVRVVAAGRQAGDEPARMQLEVDGRAVERFDVAQDEPADFEAALSLRGGAHRIAVSFVNDYYDPKHPDPRRRDRNLLIDLVDVVGPLDPRPVPSQQAWLHAAADGRTDIARLRSQVRAMLPRLWRRPVAGPELQRVQRAGVDLLRAGAPMLEAQRFVLTAALTSPNFLFRVEPEGAGRGARELSDHALASRLSFFL